MMRRVAKILGVAALLIASSYGYAGQGWTDAGAISSIEQSPASGSLANQVLVVASVSGNLSGCTVPTGFYFTIADDRQKRLLALLLSAHLAGRNVRIFFTGTCNTVNYAQLDGVMLQ